MLNTLNILQKVLVNHFYRLNAGFFLFVFFVLFGIPQNLSQFHLSLIDGFIKNPSMLLLVMAAWLLYNVKCLDYVIKQLFLPQQQFLFCLYGFGNAACYGYLLFVQLMVYMPVFAYAMFVLGVAIKTAHIIAALQILLFNAAMLLLTPLLYLRAVQKRPLLQNVPVPRIAARVPKPLFSLPLHFIWRQRKQMLFVSKFLSIVLLYIFFKLYQPERYDIRPMLLCFMLAAAANSIIVFEMKAFEDFFLQMQRNFPLTTLRSFANSLLAFTVLMLPELLFIFKGYPLYFSAIDYLQTALFGIGLLALFYAILFTGNTTMDGYMRIIFAILATLFFILLYNPGFLLELAIWALAFGLYASYYYSFEKAPDS